MAGDGAEVRAHGLYLAGRIETRNLTARRVGSTPLVVEVGDQGLCVVFRYGVLVFVGTTSPERGAFVASLAPAFRARFAEPVEDELTIRIRSDGSELLERQRALERKLAVAEQATRAVLDLRLHTQSLRVEWYIVLLIVVEIFISLYDLSHP